MLRCGLTLTAPEEQEDLGEIDCGVFVSFDSQEFRRIVREFNVDSGDK